MFLLEDPSSGLMEWLWHWLATQGYEFNFRLFRCSHACASVTKQYNLVPVMGQRCPATGKVTVGLVLHWSYALARLSWLIQLRTQGLSKGGEHPTNTPHGVWYSLPFSVSACNVSRKEGWLDKLTIYLHFNSHFPDERGFASPNKSQSTERTFCLFELTY